jgi:short subunit dehydrogenase-like uncharacterized protein
MIRPMSSVESPSQPKPFRILLIGAAGNFGARLARLLTREAGVALVLAGRKRASLEAIAKEIGGGETAVLDRSKLDAAQLGSLGVDLVIDASGPFQTAQTNVIEAAIGAGVELGPEMIATRACFAASSKSRMEPTKRRQSARST